MSWSILTDDWRLKLTALGLAILMLGAVAFSQNPPTTRTLSVSLVYSYPPNIILINPPARTNVTYSGLADVIANVNTSNLIATVDATGARPGNAVRLNVTARSLISSGIVTVQSPAPIAVNIDTLQAVDVPVQVTAQAAAGWSIDPSKTLATCPGAQNPSPCKVHFVGPVSWESGLKALATFPGRAIGKTDSLNQQVQLVNSSGPVDFTIRTVPTVSTDVTAVGIHVEAFAGTTHASVPVVDSPPTHGPPSGYRVTGITVTPSIVTISGDPAAVARVQTIVLPAVDLSRTTSDATFSVAIQYPTGLTGDTQTATVKYSISPNPNVSPSP
ncbi:MAG TPA: CdaR family protein [Candidatus Sulfotelmatobacter sp.]|nr:CdaR family protein [Candidatus Sulfotelmatobacter sp.]